MARAAGLGGCVGLWVPGAPCAHMHDGGGWTSGLMVETGSGPVGTGRVRAGTRQETELCGLLWGRLGEGAGGDSGSSSGRRAAHHGLGLGWLAGGTVRTSGTGGEMEAGLG